MIFSIIAINKEIDTYIEEMKPEVFVEINNVDVAVDVKEDGNKIKVVVEGEEKIDITNDEPEEVEEMYIKVTSEQGLNIRQEPNIESERIGVLYYGEEVKILEESEQWYRIEQGYVYKEYTIKI
jgi:hypothetical protein